MDKLQIIFDKAPSLIIKEIVLIVPLMNLII